MSEPAEALSIQVDRQRLIRGNQDINTQIKLLATNEQRIHDVPLYNIRLSSRRLRLPPQFILPLGYLLQLRKQENAATLRLTNRFHDPHLRRLLKLLHKQTIVAR